MTIQQPTGHDAVRRKLEALTLVPFSNYLLILGKTWRPFFAEITGLSVGRIAQGNLDNIRPSTLKRSQENATAWVFEQGQKRGWTPEECSAQMAAVPKKRDGDVGFWASWIKSLEIQEVMCLPLTIALALKADELLQSLIDACNHNDIDRFKRDLSAHHEASSQTVLIDSVEPIKKLLSDDPEWTAIANWVEINAILDNLLEHLLLDIYTGLDVEWGNQYFRAMKPVPSFLWIAPRINDRWDVQSGAFKSKNSIYRPVRRLFELSYVVVYRHYRNDWPSAPVGRSEIGNALQLSDACVGNYFDGTRKLTIDTYKACWEALCRHLRSARSSPEDILHCPTPLAVMTITWQNTLIVNTSEGKLRSFTLLGEYDYKRRWEGHRRKWASLLLLPSGNVDWPDWLLNQSVSSKSVRSLQSSGLSSFPRECQYSS